MRNKCIKCGANVLEGDLCWKHKPKKMLKKTNHKSPQLTFDQKIHQMKDFFLEIWKERPIHKCEMCGKWLGNEPLSYMFDHILEKSKYPTLKFEKSNIAFLCLNCHDSKTRGFPSELYQQKILNTKKLFGK